MLALPFRSRRRAAALPNPVTQKAIGRVVLAGFTLVILLLLAAGLISVRGISAIRSATAELFDEQARTQDLLDAVLREQRAINAIYASFAQGLDQVDRQQLQSQLESSDRDIETIAADAADEPEQALWRDLYRAVTGFSSQTRSVLGDASGQARPLRQLMKAHQAVMLLVDKLVEAQARRGLQLKQQLEAISGRLLRESAILLGASLLLALVCAVFTFRLTVDLIERLATQNAELGRVSWNLLEKQETTARRFSHELHDELGQSLTAVKANLVALSDASDGTQGRFDDCLHLVDEAISNVRELSQLLRPTVLDDFGLPASLRWLCDRFKQRTRIDVEFSSSFSGRLADETETHLFRIAQEALTNVARHSGATRIEVSLTSDKDVIRLRIADNGRGVAPAAAAAASGLGMVGMRARARSAGGELKVESTPGQGTVILAGCPLTRREEGESGSPS